VDITIGSIGLHLASALMGRHDPHSAEVKKALRGLKSVRVRNYHFASDFVYSQADLDSVRAQLSAPGWSELVHARDNRRNENVDIYVSLEGQTVKGLAIVASEPREFTIVNIVGTIDIQEVAKVERGLGLPGQLVERNPADDSDL
jgi:hypothetical protein